MKTVIQLPVPPLSVFLVQAGDYVTTKTTLAETRKTDFVKRVPLAKLLKIPNANILKFLKKRIDDDVAEGDVLAAKRGVFSSYFVKSPVAGRIKEVDLVDGSLILTEQFGQESLHVSSYVDGRVVRIGKDHIDIEINGHEFPAQKGNGTQVRGKLLVMEKQDVGMYDFPEDVEGSIVLAQSITEESLIKLDVLGASGCIVEKPIDTTILPWAVVRPDTLEHIARFNGKYIVLRPDMKQILVCL